VAASAFNPHLVVDGSNIATEGRDLPSLAQLDEAVQAFMAEFGPQIVTVVVDASFPNRIDRSERRTYEDAVVAGEIITPPAGAIGRGDAFILQIADRAHATILSNDSFQEFHGQYDWLFDPGRLVGGKPVPHVGWVFVDRTPVRGPTSRRAVSMAKAELAAKATKATKAEKVPKVEKAAKPAKAAKVTKATKAAKAAQAAKTAQPAAKPAKPAKAAKPTKAAKAAKAAEPVSDQAPGYNEALPFIEFVGAHPVGSQVEGSVEQFSSHGAYVRADGILGYAPLKYLADPAPRSARQVLRAGEKRSFVVVAVEPARRGVDLALPGIPLGEAASPPLPPPPVEPVDPPAKAPKAKAPKAKKAKAVKKTTAKKATEKKTATKKAAVAKKAARPRKATAGRKAASRSASTPTSAGGTAADQ
jgi:hypothetical protein